MTEYHEELLAGLVHEGVNDRLNTFGAVHGLKPLQWSVEMDFEPGLIGSVLNGASESEARETSDAWGKLLGLRASTAAEEALGIPDWTGDVGDWRVSVLSRAAEGIRE